MFPFSIHFKRHVIIDNPKSLILAFEHIQTRLEGLQVDQVICRDNHIDFKNKFFNRQGKWNLMAPVNSGYFDYEKNTSTMKYAISTSTGFIFAFVFSSIVYFASSSLMAGLFMFLWLYGMNVIIAIVRHQKFFNGIISDLQIKFSELHT